MLQENLINKSVLKFVHKPNKHQSLPIVRKPLMVGTQPKKPFVRQAFLDVSMVNRHNGFSRIAKDAGIDIAKLKHGEFVLFINADRTKIAVFGASGTLTYVYHPEGHKISTLIINKLPEIFGGKEYFDYDSALKPFLEEYLK